MLNLIQYEVFKKQCKTLNNIEPTIISLKDFYKKELIKEDIYDIPFLIDFKNEVVYMNIFHTIRKNNLTCFYVYNIKRFHSNSLFLNIFDYIIIKLK